MAASRRPGEVSRLCLCSLVLLMIAGAALGQVELPYYNVETSSVPRAYVQRALNLINEQAPDGRTYKQGSLVAAQIMVSSVDHQLYRLTFNMEPVCKSSNETCPRESCTVDQRIGELGPQNGTTSGTARCQESPVKKPTEDQQPQQQQVSSLDREVQISTDHNDRPFVAVKATQSDYCPGCPYELNPSLPGLSAFGDQVLRSMDASGVGDFKHKLVSIVRVTRAVPPGLNVIQYQLLMEIGESSCLRTSLIEVSECPLQTNLPIKFCLVTFEERPWQQGSRRIAKNNCTDSLLLDNDNEVSASVDPSSIFFESLAAGSATKAEEDGAAKTEFYDQIAQEAQEAVFRMPNVEVASASNETSTTGSSSSIDQEKMKAFDKFLEDFDLPIKTENASTSSPKPNDKEPVQEDIIVKEHVGDEVVLATAAEEEAQKSRNPVLLPTVETARSNRAKRDIKAAKALEGNKAGLRKLAIKAIEMIDELDEDNKKKHLIEVIDAKRERQSHGILYHLTLEVAPTDCREAERSTECLDEVIPGPSQICKCDVLTSEKKPLAAPKLQHYSCKTKSKELAAEEVRPRRQLGAPNALDKNDPEVLKFVELGRASYSENLGDSNEPIVHQVKEVTRQVVAGLLYQIKVDMGRSTCKKGVTENCQLMAEEGLRECTIRAWTRAWIDNGKPEIKVTCSDNNEVNNQGQRRKRSLRGANYSDKMLEQARQLKEEKLFREFAVKYKRSYASEEERQRRFEIFRDNLDMIEELQRNEQGTGRYGVTMFADLTKAEFKDRYLGLDTSLRSENDIPLPKAKIPDVELPTEYDWRHYNVVTPVKNQGSCGSCWAFSVTGNVEGQYAIKHGKLLSLSEQELVDCDKLDQGCNGGLPDNAYRAIEELGGLEEENDYPYEAENEKCHFNKNKARVTVVSGLNITSNETQMAQWLVKNGPMSIGINANAMQFYMGGVSHPYHFLCSSNSLDHGVLIVGYGVKTYPIFKKTLPYWIIKNSWGPHWGEQGYYRVYRGDGTCGVNQMVTSAVVA